MTELLSCLASAGVWTQDLPDTDWFSYALHSHDCQFVMTVATLDVLITNVCAGD